MAEEDSVLGWREEGNFDTAAVIHVFLAIGVNGACRVTAHLALRGAACRDTQSTLPSFDQKLSGDRKKKKMVVQSNFFSFFFLFFGKWRGI